MSNTDIQLIMNSFDANITGLVDEIRDEYSDRYTLNEAELKRFMFDSLLRKMKLSSYASTNDLNDYSVVEFDGIPDEETNDVRDDVMARKFGAGASEVLRSSKLHDTLNLKTVEQIWDKYMVYGLGGAFVSYVEFLKRFIADLSGLPEKVKQIIIDNLTN